MSVQTVGAVVTPSAGRLVTAATAYLGRRRPVCDEFTLAAGRQVRYLTIAARIVTSSLPAVSPGHKSREKRRQQ